MVCFDDLKKKKFTKNSLKLLKDSDEVEAKNPRISINEKLINKLSDAYCSRSLLAKWTSVPECFITKECTPYHNTKSAILDCITSDQACIESQSMMDAIVIDLSVIIGSQAPLLSYGSTFDFSLLVIDRIRTMAESCNAQRIDIVTDQYTELSIKSPTRLARISESFGQQILFDCETRVPTDDVCQSFLTDEMNKTKLNEFIIWKFVSSNSWKHQYCFTMVLKML